MNLVVIGAQWGDEGKGKIVDYLAGEANRVVRFSGGANAGHTIVTGDKVYKLHLVPSGVVYPDKEVVLGAGMVIDLDSLFEELAMVKSQGLDWEGRVFISDRAHIVLPRYKEEDKALDSKRRNPIGTTGRGIGVTYSQKAHRDGIRVGDLWDENVFSKQLPEDQAYLAPYKEKLKDMVINHADYMYRHKDDNILFEGAQGVLLDLDGGTYPFCSSGYSCSAGAAIGGSVGPRRLDKILGVFKAYQTRVGNGPFPTAFSVERDGGLEEKVREIGNEYGVTTGRPRQCGYLDLVALKYACWTNSIDSLVLTHLDVYDTMDEVEVCTGYEINGEETTVFPSRISDLEAVKPVTSKFKGWNKSIQDCKSYEELPQEAQDYLKFIEDFVETPISIVSVGPDRAQTFNRTEPWTK